MDLLAQLDMVARREPLTLPDQAPLADCSRRSVS